MPPKKDKAKSKKNDGGKKEKKPKAEAGSGEPVLETVDENTKQFFLLQIKDLEEKLKRYQKKCDELEILCKKYEIQYETSNTDKKDIISNLRKEMDKKSDDILDLNDRLVGLQQAKDAEKETFEKQLTDLRTEFQESKDILTNQNNSLLAKLTALEEFKSQKEELLAKLESLEQHIQFLEADHKNNMNVIEKKVIIDKDRLKKDMIIKVSQVAAEFRRVSNKQMADTTKRTIKENVSINSQLQKMSDKVMELVVDNDESKIKDKVLKQQIDLLEDNEKELAKKNVSNLKIIRLLTEKCRSQEAIINELEDRCNGAHENAASQQQTIANLENQIESMGDAAGENERMCQEITRLLADLEMATKYRSKVERVLKQASDALVIALSKDAAAMNSKQTSSDEAASEWNSIERRNNMLEHMLILLNSAASLGFGPNPQEFGSNGAAAYNQRPCTSEYPGSGKGVRKHQIPPSSIGKAGQFGAHYQLGDLGLVPRQSEHLLTSYEKSKLFGAQKELGSLQKLTKKTVATQTIDWTKASIFGIGAADSGSGSVDAANSQHPIFADQERRMPTKAQILMPINGQHRVTDKVF